MQWPVPFGEGITRVLGLRGQRVVMLASGDPFWFGAGSVITRHLRREEWHALPGVSVFSLAASRLGWALETTLCLGLHAAPLTRLRPYLAPGNRAIVLLRDGDAVSQLAGWLDGLGFGGSSLHVMQALGGPGERLRRTTAGRFAMDGIAHPVCVGLALAGMGVGVGDGADEGVGEDVDEGVSAGVGDDADEGVGAVITLASGRCDALFDSDGQITKRPMRALTLSALAPRHGEHLWDIGAGSGSIAIEWLLGHRSTRATAIEARADRARRMRGNGDRLGVDRLHIVTGEAPAVLPGLERPDAVFIGGGLSPELLIWLQAHLRRGTRLVANAVTVESEALMGRWQAALGGDLLRVDLAHLAPLGAKRAWKPSLPVVQWRVIL